MATPTELIATVAPEFVGAANLDGVIEVAEARTSQSAFGDNRSLAVALLAAHTLALQARGSTGGGGPITSVKEGDLAISYGPSMAGSVLASTSYGEQLATLRRENIMGARTRSG